MLFLFHKGDFFNLLDIEPETFTKFMKEVQGGYLDNKYHNATHAADVT